VPDIQPAVVSSHFSSDLVPTPTHPRIGSRAVLKIWEIDFTIEIEKTIDLRARFQRVWFQKTGGYRLL
jgi:hypothetical protein